MAEENDSKMYRPVRVELTGLTDDQKGSMRSTLELYGEIYQEYAEWMIEKKSTNATSAHRALYDGHKKCGLPTSLIQCSRDVASANIKSFNSNLESSSWRA